jgi:hypothetical protein
VKKLRKDSFGSSLDARFASWYLFQLCRVAKPIPYGDVVKPIVCGGVDPNSHRANVKCVVVNPIVCSLVGLNYHNGGCKW